MIVAAVYAVAIVWALAWTVACAREAVRLHRALYPRGVRFVFALPQPSNQPPTTKRGTP